ncbi:hypothetical protein F5X68DRAFT_198618 [Plectosphaerella plurivora]|uniref:Uncharacterized protein n=1 Tax=Plectosphaerella plurivora TaxID=936078 RepID=A0A9P9AFS8_9PEZI|nr:hypothetical protein F5X68DRAFT_198618 [Plectosphaerella plurivora]
MTTSSSTFASSPLRGSQWAILGSPRGFGTWVLTLPMFLVLPPTRSLHSPTRRASTPVITRCPTAWSLGSTLPPRLSNGVRMTGSTLASSESVSRTRFSSRTFGAPPTPTRLQTMGSWAWVWLSRVVKQPSPASAPPSRFRFLPMPSPSPSLCLVPLRQTSSALQSSVDVMT